MLFNSLEFIGLFLPLTLAIFLLLSRHPQKAMAWLLAASLLFYGYWKPIYLPLILVSITLNYLWGRWLQYHPSRWLLGWGVALNLGLIGFFKYGQFFADNLQALTGLSLSLPSLALPLGISFFTFQQIAYLVDTYRGKAHESHWGRYSLFVTFFPQLIAGPIVHHGQLLDQFTQPSTYRFQLPSFTRGLTLFIFGLAKKVLVADTLAQHANVIFSASERGIPVTLLEGWGGALAYTFQLYYDFSGYSDMAIGLGLLFNIQLPQNFNAPYRATNIIEFWRRWHMTLSQFLRDYVYIPLGGNRLGERRRILNLMATMLIGGLWHGAGWLFVIWGALHGLYLTLNHLWQRLFPGEGSWKGGVVTFASVVVAWVFFRSETLAGALNLLQGMAGLHGVETHLDQLQFTGRTKWITEISCVALITFAPFRSFKWSPTPAWGLATGLLAFAALRHLLGVHSSEFLYFNF